MAPARNATGTHRPPLDSLLWFVQTLVQMKTVFFFTGILITTKIMSTVHVKPFHDRCGTCGHSRCEWFQSDKLLCNQIILFIFFFTLCFCFNTYIYCMRVESSAQCETKSIHLITLVSTAFNIRIDLTTASLVILTTRDLVCRVSRPRWHRALMSPVSARESCTLAAGASA